LRLEGGFNWHDDMNGLLLVVNDIGSVGGNLIVDLNSHFLFALDSLNGVAVD